jgi:hypothetical protein
VLSGGSPTGGRGSKSKQNEETVIPSTLMMEAIHPSETPVDLNRTTKLYVPEDRNLLDNLKASIILHIQAATFQSAASDYAGTCMSRHCREQMATRMSQQQAFTYHVTFPCP